MPSLRRHHGIHIVRRQATQKRSPVSSPFPEYVLNSCGIIGRFLNRPQSGQSPPHLLEPHPVPVMHWRHAQTGHMGRELDLLRPTAGELIVCRCKALVVCTTGSDPAAALPESVAEYGHQLADCLCGKYMHTNPRQLTRMPA
jgi:hypothetical protein